MVTDGHDGTINAARGLAGSADLPVRVAPHALGREGSLRLTDRLANAAAYARSIRDWLTSRYGTARRRVIADSADALSLHDGIRPQP